MFVNVQLVCTCGADDESRGNCFHEALHAWLRPREAGRWILDGEIPAHDEDDVDQVRDEPEGGPGILRLLLLHRGQVGKPVHVVQVS